MGKTHFSAPIAFTSVQNISGPGAIDVTSAKTLVTTTGADAFTLADGTEGQMKQIIMVAFGGIGTVTPSNLLGFSTIAFDAVGDSVNLMFTGGNWCVIGGNAATLA